MAYPEHHLWLHHHFLNKTSNKVKIKPNLVMINSNNNFTKLVLLERLNRKMYKGYQLQYLPVGVNTQILALVNVARLLQARFQGYII